MAAFTVGVIVLCALFSGLVSALSSNGSHVMVALQESSRSHSGGTARARLRKVLLVLEVGLTVVLLVGGGLLLKSYQRLRSTDIGVPVENVLTMHVSLARGALQTTRPASRFFRATHRARSCVAGCTGSRTGGHASR